VPDVTVLRDGPQHLREKERISLGVPIQKREQLPLDLLSVKRSLEPLFHLVAREIRDHQLARKTFRERQLAM
jgi:hypothetical protein